MAGVAAAATDNGEGIAVGGMERQHCFRSRCWTRNGEGFTSTVINGIYEAVDRGAKVINLSLATDDLRAAAPGRDHRGLQPRRARGRGRRQQRRSGRHRNTSPKYPAAMDHVLSVAATVQNDTLAPFSRRGPWVDMAAPGNGLDHHDRRWWIRARPAARRWRRRWWPAPRRCSSPKDSTPRPTRVTAQLVRTGQPINDGVGGVIRRLNVGQATETASPYGTGFPRRHVRCGGRARRRVRRQGDRHRRRRRRRPARAHVLHADEPDRRRILCLRPPASTAASTWR